MFSDTRIPQFGRSVNEKIRNPQKIGGIGGFGASFPGQKHLLYYEGHIHHLTSRRGFSGSRRNLKTVSTLSEDEDFYGQANRVVGRIEDWLSSDRDPAAGLDVLNHAANLLEANQLVPECDLPSAYYETMKKNGADADGIAAKLGEWLPILRADLERRR